jgi:quercetin dioxygenase-like cupin family protein
MVASITLLLTACNNDKNKIEMADHNTTSIFPKGEKLANDYFTGDAFLTTLVARDKNNDFSASNVSFDPKARTNWHTHPKGQVLLVIDGEGYYQEKGQPARPIKKGDVVNIPENVEHWHGASAHNKMIHIAISNYKEDIQVTWLEPVTDEEYNSVSK